ncbi:MAG: FHA domain-containing protein, partial [Planctomycetota bacterium]
MARLTVIDGPDLGNEYEFEPEELRSEAVVLGRDPRARVALSDNAISREHCRLRATPRGFRVVDLGSRNRTYVNGDPVEDCMLRDGDVLRIGDTDLKFEDDGSSVELFGAASTIIKKVPIDEAVRKNGTNGTNGNGDAGLLEGGLERAVSSMKSLLDAARTLGQSRSVPELLERYLSTVTQAVGGTRAAYLVKQRKRWVSKASHSVHS